MQPVIFKGTKFFSLLPSFPFLHVPVIHTDLTVRGSLHEQRHQSCWHCQFEQALNSVGILEGRSLSLTGIANVVFQLAFTISPGLYSRSSVALSVGVLSDPHSARSFHMHLTFSLQLILFSWISPVLPVENLCKYSDGKRKLDFKFPATTLEVILEVVKRNNEW